MYVVINSFCLPRYHCVLLLHLCYEHSRIVETFSVTCAPLMLAKCNGPFLLFAFLQILQKRSMILKMFETLTSWCLTWKHCLTVKRIVCVQYRFVRCHLPWMSNLLLINSVSLYQMNHEMFMQYVYSLLSLARVRRQQRVVTCWQLVEVWAFRKLFENLWTWQNFERIPGSKTWNRFSHCFLHFNASTLCIDSKSFVKG
jgi:hypothetical protein